MYKQWLFVGLFTWLCLTVAMAAPPATHPVTGEELLINCYRGTPDAIDGDLSDWNLEAMTPAVLDVEDQIYTGESTWDGPEDCSGKFYFQWDDTNIYIAVVVNDETLSTDKSGTSIWNADCVEVFFSTTNAVDDCSEHYQFGFNIANQYWNWCNIDSDGEEVPDYLEMASSRTVGGYICEVAIEYGELLSLNFVAGNTIGIHPVLDDTDDSDREMQMTWTGREAHDQSEGYGHLYLSSEPAVAPELSRNPSPEDGQTDVAIDSVLSWTAGQYAVTHDVYLGVVFGDVNQASRDNPMDVLVSQGQSATTYLSAETMEYGQTYYWRVDEVNGAPDNTIYKGQVWSFTVEPMGYAITDIVATSNIASTDASSGPERTIDGSGLNDADEHTAEATDAWLVKPEEGETVWIQYEFAKLQKLYQMLVWNYNSEFEWVLGFGFKDVTIEYSVDGVNWTVLGEFEFAQATSEAGYAANTTVSLGSVTAQYIRLTVNNAWGTGEQCGLSEVRFLAIPLVAREPSPADGETEVDIDATLQWRSGREAVSHEVYFADNQDAVADGTAYAAMVNDNSYSPGTLDFGQAYYWRVDEVNDTEVISTWEGDVWYFVTQEFAVVDDFESYDDDNRIYDTWIDGEINDTGAWVGYTKSPFAEQSIVNGGVQSMPLEYDNSKSPYYSEASRTWSTAQDWTVGAADTLRLYFYGTEDNTAETLYIGLEDSSGQVAVVAYSDSQAVLTAQWQEWTMVLSEFSGVNLAKITTVYIGLGDRDNPQKAGTGIIYVDDIGIGHPVADE